MSWAVQEEAAVKQPSWGVYTRGWLTSTGFSARLGTSEPATEQCLVSDPSSFFHCSTHEQSPPSYHLPYRNGTKGIEGSTSLFASAVVSQLIPCHLPLGLPSLRFYPLKVWQASHCYYLLQQNPLQQSWATAPLCSFCPSVIPHNS